MIATVAAHQVTSLRRQRTLLALLGLFLAMTALAGLIGWSSTRTIARVYEQAAEILRERGDPVPPDPIGLKPPLALLSNMLIYVPLVGALLALVLGHLSIADDRSHGIGRLLFSRQLPRHHYVAGKAAGAAIALALALAASLVVSVVGLLVADRELPSLTDLGRLLLFYGLSFLYLMIFALVGMVTVLLVRRRSMALLSAMGVWLVLTFAVPQFTSGLRPTASLNPVSDPVSTSSAFFDVTSRARPLSLSEQYKRAGADILRIGPQEAAAVTAGRAGALALAGALLLALAFRIVLRHDWSRSMAGE